MMMIRYKHHVQIARSFHPLSRKIIRSMQRNFQLQSIVESYKKQQGLTGPVCDMCKEKPVESRCNKCEVSYCLGCLKVYHPPTRPPFSTHSLVSIGGAAATATSTSSKANGNAEAMKAQFRQDVDDMTNGIQRANKSIAELRGSKLKVQNKTKELKDGMMIEGSKLRDFVTKMEKDQGEAITDESRQKIRELDVHLKEYQEYVRKQEDLIASVKALLKEPDENAFLKTASTMKTKILNSKQSKPRSYQSDADLSQSAEVFQTFKKRCKSLMQEEKHTAPSTPALSSELCIGHDTTIAICIPSLNVNVSEATKIDTFGYKYKKPADTDWTQGRAHADQIEQGGCIKVEGLNQGTPYSIQIRAHNPYGWSAWSSIVLAHTSGPIKSCEVPKEEPKAPRINTSGITANSESVTLKWINEHSENTEAYVVAYSPATGSERWKYQVAQNCGNSFTIENLTAGASYLFKVSACGRTGFTTWSKKVKIGLPQRVTSHPQERIQSDSLQLNDSNFALDQSTANPCLLISGMTITHPANACPSISDGFTGNSFSVFGNTIFTSGVHYWQVTINGYGSKVRLGIAKPDVAKDTVLGSGTDSWVLVMDARTPLLREGSHVLHGNSKHKSGGEWIPFSKYIGITLDYVQDRMSFSIFDGPPSPITKRTNHIFEFLTPPCLRPVFAIDEKDNNLSLEVKTGLPPPTVRGGCGQDRNKELEDLNREMLQQCAQQ
ncbi:E3 ubiquitin-protein ligase TRIM9-like [Amphiura filiformis]|uniref:E3 ubiquitin-protein ligase TRIM9-like n=1 Tax=Amphiura filiformis TaxID=82378 RepID=UPI003B20F0AD